MKFKRYRSWWYEECKRKQWMQVKVDLGHWKDDGTICRENEHRSEAGLLLSGRGMISIICNRNLSIVTSKFWCWLVSQKHRGEEWGAEVGYMLQLWDSICKTLKQRNVQAQIFKESTTHRWSLSPVAHQCEGEGKGWFYWGKNWDVEWQRG